MATRPKGTDPLAVFHPVVSAWFRDSFREPTSAQHKGWAAIARGQSVLIQAPTGSGKTLAAFLWAINRLDVRADAPVRPALPRALRLAAQGARGGRRAQPPRAARRHRAPGRARRGRRTPCPPCRSGPATRRRTSAPASCASRPTSSITTPESLYLLLTSKRPRSPAVDRYGHRRRGSRLVPTKRGAHLALSIERLEALLTRPLQRIGLSATQRPLDEVARYLGGAEPRPAGGPRGSGRARGREPGRATRRSTPTARSRAASSHAKSPHRIEADSGASGAETDLHDQFQSARGDVVYRPVTIVDAGGRKALDLHIEVPVEDMARLGQMAEFRAGSSLQPPTVHRESIWSAIYPRLLDLIRRNRSTLIFVNSRRSAERLAGALNDLAGELLVRAHHGSIARDQRIEIEDALKAGRVRGLVATSSLELGHRHGRHRHGGPDRGAALGRQRPAARRPRRPPRGRHRAGPSSSRSSGETSWPARPSRGRCATGWSNPRATRATRSTSLAQQIVAMTSIDLWRVDDLFDSGAAGGAVRRTEPPGLRRRARHALGPLSVGRVRRTATAASPGIASSGTIAAREGARRVAVDQRRHDSRPRALRRVPRRCREGRRPRRRTRRGNGLREPRGRDVRARGAIVAHRGDHPRPSASSRRRPANRARCRSGKPTGPAARWSSGERIGRLVRDLRDLPARGRRRSPDPRPRSRPRRQPRTCSAISPIRPRPPVVVPDDRTIVIERVPRRAGRLARVPALAARQPRACAVGDGRHGEHPREARPRRRDHVDRRWVRGAVS